jgi:hypothetical protein
MNAAEIVADILEHHGVKGQKWGVQRFSKEARTARSAQRQTRRLAKADVRLEKTIASKRKSNQLKIQIHNSIGPVVQSKINQLNTKPVYAKAIREGTFKDPHHPVTKQYIKEYNKMYLDQTNDYLKGFSSASGKRVVRAELNSEDFLGFSLRIQGCFNS